MKPLPDRLVTELTAERTLALRDSWRTRPRVACRRVLHKFVPRHLLPLLRPTGGAGSVGAHVSFSVQAARAEGHARRRRRSPSGTRRGKSGHAQGRQADLWDWLDGPRRRRAGGAVRPLRSASASTRSTRRATATAAPASRRTASSAASARPTAWRGPSISTWWRPAGVRPSRTISAACPSAASSKRCAKARASGRRSSSTT